MHMSTSLTAYEQERLKNIAANKAALVALGIEQDVASIRTLKTQARTVKGSAINKKKKASSVPPRTKSLRQQNLDTEGKAMPDKPVVATPDPVVRKPRKPSVPLDAAKVSTGATSAEEAATFLARLGEASIREAPAPALRKTKMDLSSLAVAEDDIAKLVPERIFSLAMHPSPTKMLVAAGDTWGRVGLWDVLAGDETPVVTFEPHSRPVAGMRFAAHLPHLLLSCSHDGTVRALDLGGGGSSAFVKLYCAPEDPDGEDAMLHALSRTAGEGGALAVCRTDGLVTLLDPRAAPGGGGTGARTQRVHEKKVFSADFSDAKPHLLATASLDRTVCLWDVRAFGGAGGKKAKPLATLEHGLSVTAARFSHSGNRLLTTCNDDLLRVFAGGKADKDWALQTAIKHNNKTGRYITAFQAEWLHGSDETVVCGSLLHPRGIDVFDASDGSAAERLEHDNVTSVVSLIAQHPTQPVLVASNSGGKCFCWRPEE